MKDILGVLFGVGSEKLINYLKLCLIKKMMQCKNFVNFDN